MADQDAWNEAFEGVQHDPSFDWDFEDDEEEGVCERVSYSPKPRATHISSSLVLVGIAIDQSVHALKPIPPSRTENTLWSYVQHLVGKPTASASSKKGARDDINV